ncbi:MAG: hypothetical protein AAGH71_08175 [Planctomycetota bacterium]
MNTNHMHRSGKARPVLVSFVVLVACAVLWLIAEVCFAVTAEPDIDTDYASQIEDLARSVQSDAPNLWSAFESIVTEHGAISERVNDLVLQLEPVRSSQTLGYQSVYEHGEIAERLRSAFEFDEQELAAELERLRLGRALYIDALNSWAETGFEERLQRISTADARFVRTVPRDQVGFAILLPELGPARQLGWALRAQMYLAAEAGEWDAYTRYFGQALWLARILEAEPIVSSGLVGVSVRSVVVEAVRQDVVAQRVPGATLARLASLLVEADPPSASHVLRGEKLWALDTAQHTHDRRGRLMVSKLQIVQGGEGLPPIANLASIVLPRRGTTERLIASYYDGMIELAELSPIERRVHQARAGTGPPPIPANQPLLQAIIPAFEKMFRSFDAASIEHAGLATLLAIERFRAEQGELPVTLGELVSAYLEELPADAWAGQAPLTYVRDDSVLGYQLYSVGSDGKDDNATRPPAGRGRAGDRDALKGGAIGTDFVFTRRDDLP